MKKMNHQDSGAPRPVPFRPRPISPARRDVIARKSLSLARLLPNIITLSALAAGLTGVRFALAGDFAAAVLAIMLAAVLDGLDGRVARMIGATSRFGAELDSLSDFVAFGVAPALCLYVWGLEDAGRLGWAVSLVYAACMALRLARFNTSLDDAKRPAWTSKYFVGVPAPAAAGLALLPIIANLEFAPRWIHLPWVVAPWLLLVSGLMISRIPTFSSKRLNVANRWLWPVFMSILLIVAGLATEPWLTILVVGVGYFLSIPLTWWTVRRSEGHPTARVINFTPRQNPHDDKGA
ncbi:MAG: CDP-diacylglycerol--serine O-phosphatidyltransferase [Candidatus Symbiobacter sp.]|nr:CDP-diacylglycerol--serine O-phosphatidyltransferase [Candidatus Symbiobacter sp.]